MNERTCPRCRTRSSAPSCPSCGWDFTSDYVHSPLLDELNPSEADAFYKKEIWLERIVSENQIRTPMRKKLHPAIWGGIAAAALAAGIIIGNFRSPNSSPDENNAAVTSETQSNLPAETWSETVSEASAADGNQTEAVITINGTEYPADITELDLSGQDLTDFSFLSSFENLKVLNLESSGITDLSPLVSLTSLEELDIRHNAIDSFAPLTNLRSLNTLGVDSEDISLDWISNLPNLTSLNLSCSEIPDLTLLSSLDHLAAIDFGLMTCDGFPDTTPLAGLPNLSEIRIQVLGLTVENFDFSSLSALSGLSSLQITTLDPKWGRGDFDLSLLSGFSNLTDLKLYGQSITDLSALTELTALTTLDLSGNLITDLSPLASLTNLTQLDLSENNISDVSPLANLKALKELDISSNNLEDISALDTLPGLHVKWDDNPGY